MRNFTKNIIVLMALAFTISFNANSQETQTFPIYFQSTEDIAGFQFNLEGAEMSGASGGEAALSGFTIGVGGNTATGFSFGGNIIPAGEGTLVELDVSSSDVSDACINNVILSNIYGNELGVYVENCNTIVVPSYGCTDATASNYNAAANTDDGSCISWEDIANDLQSQLDNIIPEDGISQADVDVAYADGVASVEVPDCEEFATENIPLNLPEGWSMFAYTCLESQDVIDAFYDISTSIVIVKDYLGNVYLPDFGFSAIDILEFGHGYQIKMIEEDTDFQFCSTIVGTSSQEEPEAELQLQIGDQHAGGIVFQINEDGTGLVADLQDLGQMNWYDAMDAAQSATSQGYDDWYLPSIEELTLMYNTIGFEGPYVFGFNYGFHWSPQTHPTYWSSTDYYTTMEFSNLVWTVIFASGYSSYYYKNEQGRVRVIRSF